MVCWLLAFMPVFVRSFTVAVGSLKLNGRAHSLPASKYVAAAMSEMKDVAWSEGWQKGSLAAKTPRGALWGVHERLQFTLG